MKKRSDEQPETHRDPMTPGAGNKAKSKKSVYIYISTLFVVVMLFMLLSYFSQQRNDTEITALHEKNITAQQNIENLQNDNIKLQSENDAYKKRIAELEKEITALKKEINTINEIQAAILSTQAAQEEQAAQVAD